MSKTQEILNLIETLPDPNDAISLEVINRKVHILVNELAGDAVYIPVRNYTSSRDAIKAIRPKGWVIGGIWQGHAIGEYESGCTFILRQGIENNVPLRHEVGWGIPNEELAELYVTIRAIQYEQGLKETE